MLVGSGIGNAEVDIPAGGAQRRRHFGGMRHVIGIPVVFQIVKTPGGPLVGVGPGEGMPPVKMSDLIVRQRLRPGAFGVVTGSAGELGVGGDPGGGVDAGLQAQPMDGRAQSLHVGKLLVALQGVIEAGPFPLPGVIDVDVGPAVVDQAGSRHRAGRAEDLLLIDRFGPAIPAVPAHGRRERDRIAHRDPKRFLGVTLGVMRMQANVIAAGLRQRAGDSAGAGVHRQAGRESLDREFDRPPAGRRDVVKERRTRPHAKHRRAVESRGRRRSGRQTRRTSLRRGQRAEGAARDDRQQTDTTTESAQHGGEGVNSGGSSYNH